MLLKDFYKIHFEKGDISPIPVSEIKLTEKCHIKATNDGHTITGGKQNSCVIVTEDTDGKYNLLVGWADYMLAVQNEYKEIPAIIMDKEDDGREPTRHNFMMWLSSKTTFGNLTNIKVTKSFIQNPPNQYKIDSVRKQANNDISYFLTHPIIISENNVLLDGYVKYLVACELKITWFNVRQMDTKIFQKYFYKNKKHKNPKIPTIQT